MSEKINVGLIGLGGMGQVHFNAYRENSRANLVAVADPDEAKIRGEWGTLGLNIGGMDARKIDMTGISPYTNWEDLIRDPNVGMVDICLPTPLHAPVTLAALKAGKHVLCEKPMARTTEEAQSMIAAAREANKQLLIGHCLRFWPHYVKAKEYIDSGELGPVRHARLFRFSPSPRWSYQDWLRTGRESGGAVLDMHIHDIDTALWWFGKPSTVETTGLVRDGLPVVADALWRYEDGPHAGLSVNLHGSWDPHGGNFNMTFRISFEKGMLEWDMAAGPTLSLWQDGTETKIEVEQGDAYACEIDAFLAALQEGRSVTQLPPESSLTSLEVTLQELGQIQG